MATKLLSTVPTTRLLPLRRRHLPRTLPLHARISRTQPVPPINRCLLTVGATPVLAARIHFLPVQASPLVSPLHRSAAKVRLLTDSLLFSTDSLLFNTDSLLFSTDSLRFKIQSCRTRLQRTPKALPNSTKAPVRLRSSNCLVTRPPDHRHLQIESHLRRRFDLLNSICRTPRISRSLRRSRLAFWT